jgi:hypothetical protein
LCLVDILVITSIVQILLLAVRQPNQLSPDPQLTEWTNKNEESTRKRRQTTNLTDFLKVGGEMDYFVSLTLYYKRNYLIIVNFIM